MKLKKGDRVWLSEEGHNGFFYPKHDSETLLFDTTSDPRSWIGGGDKKPVMIPENAIFATGSTDKKVLVWIER